MLGYKCFPYLGDYRNNKLEPKSLPYAFIGHSIEHKGYKCYYPPRGCIYILTMLCLIKQPCHFLRRHDCMAIIKLMGSSLHSQIGRQPQSTKLLPSPSLISGFTPATNIIPSLSPTVDLPPTMTTPRYLNFHVARVTHDTPIVPKSIIFAKCQPRWVAAMDEKGCCPKCKSGPHGTGTSP